MYNQLRISASITLALVAALFLLLKPEGGQDKKAPDYFKAGFETTKGTFVIESYREWSPYGVDRLYRLITEDYFTDIPLYRVVEGFVAQFGTFEPEERTKWGELGLPDEPVLMSNYRGTVAYARLGPETRSSQLYINLVNNARLDTVNFNDVIGFPVIARVVSGMEVADTFTAYGNEPPMAADTVDYPPAFFREKFPDMDYILSAKILEPGDD